METMGNAVTELAQGLAKSSPATTRDSDRRPPRPGEGAFAAILSKVGRRYRDASFNSYVADRSGQAEAAASLREYAANWADNQNRGRGIILYGPRGGGKDHLAIATLGKILFDNAATCEWVDGQDLYEQMRDRMGADAPEREAIRRYTTPDILLLSDPIPQSGDKGITDYQQSVLWRIVDRRYRDMRPIWMTINVAGAADMSLRLGAQLADRLMDGACVVQCDWPTYRAPATVVKRKDV